MLEWKATKNENRTMPQSDCFWNYLFRKIGKSDQFTMNFNEMISSLESKIKCTDRTDYWIVNIIEKLIHSKKYAEFWLQLPFGVR